MERKQLRRPPRPDNGEQRKQEGSFFSGSPRIGGWGAFLFLLSLTAAHAQQPSPSELRGMWVVRTSITSPAAVHHVVQSAVAHHINALFVQVRGRGDAFYQSELEPRAEELAGQPPSFDPLAQVITEAHAAHIEVHAWLNTCYVWGAGRRPYSHAHVVNTHPDWLARDAHGNYSLKTQSGCEGAFLTPANLAARQHIHDVFCDVARRYDVDGVHFDYVRYPNSGYDYSVAALSRFQIAMQSRVTDAQKASLTRRLAHDRLAYPHTFPALWQDFRRQQVTEMVENISTDVKQIKPYIVVSAAVFADYADARSLRGQDWKRWLADGALDAVVPMAYGADTGKVAAQIADAVHAAQGAGRFAYAGLGAWHIPARSTLAKLNAARTLGAQGTVLFSYGGMTRDGTTNAYLDAVTDGAWQSVVPAPAMPWLPVRPDVQANIPLSSAPTAGS